jgi:hypothetical protein
VTLADLPAPLQTAESAASPTFSRRDPPLPSKASDDSNPVYFSISPFEVVGRANARSRSALPTMISIVKTCPPRRLRACERERGESSAKDSTAARTRVELYLRAIRCTGSPNAASCRDGIHALEGETARSLAFSPFDERRDSLRRRSTELPLVRESAPRGHCRARLAREQQQDSLTSKRAESFRREFGDG